MAIDRAKEGRVNTATAPILINVQDIEDQPPEFVKVTPVVRVEEDVAVGTKILQGKLKHILYIKYNILKPIIFSNYSQCY